MLGGSVPGMSNEMRCQPELRAPEGLPGACCWWEDSALLYVGLSTGCLSVPMTWWLASPEQAIQETQAEASVPFRANSRSQIASLPPYSFATQTSPHSWWMETTTGCEGPGSEDHWDRVGGWPPHETSPRVHGVEK